MLADTESLLCEAKEAYKFVAFHAGSEKLTADDALRAVRTLGMPITKDAWKRLLRDTGGCTEFDLPAFMRIVAEAAIYGRSTALRIDESINIIVGKEGIEAEELRSRMSSELVKKLLPETGTLGLDDLRIIAGVSV